MQTGYSAKEYYKDPGFGVEGGAGGYRKRMCVELIKV